MELALVVVILFVLLVSLFLFFSFRSVEQRFDFPGEELKILQYWDEIDAFQTSLKLSKDRPRYTFLDGPPFATGLPHYGHLLAGTIKDVVLRYASQTGHHVERRFGWDCHGLPVEYEIDKKLDIKSKDDVMKMGIAAYNAECRAIVMRYSGEWEGTVRRMARWIDFRNDYKTMYPSFMESVWWVFRQLFDRDQIYRGFRVMPYSTACRTPLSNFEVALNYKDTQDPSITIEMPLLEKQEKVTTTLGIEHAVLLVWTTTPWTLPSNLAVCVHPDLDYVLVQVKEGNKQGKIYIVAASCLADVMKSTGLTSEKYTVIRTVKGRVLEGLEYMPPFDFFASRKNIHPRTWTVVVDEYVTSDTGTGLVHQAPAFGEDDFNICRRYEITGETDVPCPIDDEGRFTAPVTTYQGQFWQAANPQIIKDLEAKGRMFARSTLTHSYPFCWRSDTPLIYRAIPCWFVRVQNIIPQLIEASSKTRWVPDFVLEKRFQNWLSGARDWAISRNRYWGTPIPIWANDDFSEIVCIGSVEELRQRTGKTEISDLHRENVDNLTIPSEKNPGTVLKRVEEVLDCWFESGSVPYATEHYPFENKDLFEQSFPADFIAEGLDQTRGWFYTLTVLGVHLFGQVPFRNLIVNGLVLAADGKKMSKRLKNYPEPNLIFDQYGADALRLYLINSPVVRAEALRFKEDGVRSIVRDVLLPWLNAYRFLATQLEARSKGETNPQSTFRFNPPKYHHNRDNVMDAWILASLQSLIKTVRGEMAEYHLYAVVPPLLRFIEQLTNWYIRFNRRRLRGEVGVQDQQTSLSVLLDVLYTFCIMMAPFTPFLAENIYQQLRPNLESSLEQIPDDRSVHFLLFPTVREEYFDEDMERAFGRLQRVIEAGRTLREAHNLPLKTPLREVVILVSDEQFLNDLNGLVNYIEEELNVRTVRIAVAKDDQQFKIEYRAAPNFAALGRRLRGDLPKVQRALTSLTQPQLIQLRDTNRLIVEGHELSLEDVAVTRVVDLPPNSSHVVVCEATFVLLLDINLDEGLKEEGLAREILNRVQRLRKKANLRATDKVRVLVETETDPEGELKSTLSSQIDYLSKALHGKLMIKSEAAQQDGIVLMKEKAEVGSGVINLTLLK